MVTFRDVLPPIIYNRFKKGGPIIGKLYLKEYDSFEKAAATGSYNNHKIVEVVARKTRDYISGLSNLIAEKQNLQNLLVINYILARAGENKINVIEIGGACGAFYYFTSSFHPGVFKSWTVVETPEMVERADKDFANQILKFTSNVDLIKHDVYPSICIALGAIQYFNEPMLFLNNLLNSNYDFIYISRLVVDINSTNPIITVQSSQLRDNGPGNLSDVPDEIVQYACTILSLKEFNSTINRSKYLTKYSFNESEVYTLLFLDKEIFVKNIGVLLSLK